MEENTVEIKVNNRNTKTIRDMLFVKKDLKQNIRLIIKIKNKKYRP